MMLSGCGPSANEPVNVALIAEDGSVAQSGVRLSNAGQHFRGATSEGLVAFGPTGEVVPAVAERWIITDDGLSYIFRLRNSNWPSGDPITGGDIRARLLANLAALEGTSLGYDLAKITDVREMTGRVIEIRLASPMPDFLRLMAQPELGFFRDGNGAGPMLADSDEASGLLGLAPLTPEQRGFPGLRNWDEIVRPVLVRGMSAKGAVDAFANGEVDLVLGGGIANFPLADLGPLSRANIRMDPAHGLFGLVVRANDGMFADPDLREALAMAIDREALIQPFNVSGWQSSWSIVPRALWTEIGPEAPGWTELDMEQRRQIARQRVAEWANAQPSDGVGPSAAIGLPPGPGSEMLFAQLASDFALIGVEATLVAPGQGADLELHDRVARFNAPRWFINQFHCEIRSGPCSEAADIFIEESITETAPRRKSELVARAALSLQDEGLFIGFGAPIRWSLVRSDVEAFQENPWAVHPLFPLSGAPN